MAASLEEVNKLWEDCFYDRLVLVTEDKLQLLLCMTCMLMSAINI